MNKWLRKNLAVLLTLCMCLSLCPATAFAATETAKVEAVTATAQPLDSAANAPVTVTTANIFPVQSNTYFTNGSNWMLRFIFIKYNV